MKNKEYQGTIIVENLSKLFYIRKRKKGFIGSITSLFYAEKYPIKAVDNISFIINKGEIVGYLGPNGAGKSTTIKMLTGILMPTSGKILVNGYEPFSNRKIVAKNIGVVFGQKTQLWWDLPLYETFDLLRIIYKIDKKEFQKRLDEYIEILGLDSFINQQVRKLSLGQRMRADLAASLIHNPDILFLDEPTIGLDILTKDIVRKTIKMLNKQKQITVILTTHDIEDIEYLANRLILIDKGKIRYDGKLDYFVKSYQKTKRVIIHLENEVFLENQLNGYKIIKNEQNRFYEIEMPIQESVSKIIQEIQIIGGKIHDISVKKQELGDTLKEIYKGKSIEFS
jgi:ABC-2 type transport system ATP-binding protein